MKIVIFTGLLSLTSNLFTTGESSLLYLLHILVNNTGFLIVLALRHLKWAVCT